MPNRSGSPARGSSLGVLARLTGSTPIAPTTTPAARSESAEKHMVPAPLHTTAMDGYRAYGPSQAEPRLRRSRRRHQRGKGGSALGTLGGTPSGRAQGSVSPSVATTEEER